MAIQNGDFDSSGVSLEQMRAARGDAQTKEIPIIDDEEETTEKKEDIEKKEDETSKEGEQTDEVAEEGEEKEEKPQEKDAEKEKVQDEDVIDAQILADLKKKALQFDVLQSDYTIKTKKLAEYERSGMGKPAPLQAQQDLTDEEIAKLAEEENFDVEATKNAAKLIKKLLPRIGYVNQQVLEQKEYATVERTQIDLFLEKNPEFKPENDPQNIKWNALMNHLAEAYGGKPRNPKYIASTLNKAKEDLYPTKKNDDSDLAKAFVRIRKNKVATMGGGGNDGGGSPAASSAFSLTTKQTEALRRGGWTEEEIKEYYG